MIEIIVGTNRPGSNTRKVAAQLLDIYKKYGIAAQLLDLAALPGEIFSPSSYAAKPAAFEPFAKRVVDAKGIHIVTPEYNGSAPGVLKYFIDMLKFPESFEGKPAAFTGLSAGMSGALRPIEHLQQIFSHRGGYVFPVRVFIAGIDDELGADGKLKSPELVARLDAQARGFSEFVKRFS